MTLTRTRALAGALSLAAAAALAGCGTPVEMIVQDRVKELTADLASGSFDSGVILEPTEAEIWHAYALGPLIDATRTVEAGDIAVDGNTAEVDLTWTFQIGSGQVSALAHATLAKDDGEWHLAWTPEVLHEAAGEDSVYAVRAAGDFFELVLLNAANDGSGSPGDLLVGSSGK